MSNSHLHAIFAQALEPFAPKEERKPVMLWAPKDADFVVDRVDGGWALEPVTDRAKTWCEECLLRSINKDGKYHMQERVVDGIVAALQCGFVVYDPKVFYRNARPLTGVDDPHGSD